MRSAECGVRSAENRSVDYGVGKTGSIKIWSMEKKNSNE